MRKTTLANGEHYHTYNRGTDKRDIFLCREDMERFFLCMQEFNCVDPTGGIFEIFHGEPFRGLASKNKKPLVEFVAYCLNPNHYHFVLKQVAENGIAKFMQRLGTGYTMYFNEKYKRSGGLFQGTYKAKHISSNEYLLYLIVYVNLNFKVHQFRGLASKLWMSSWDEYIGKDKTTFCKKDIILSQFSSPEQFAMYSEPTLKIILRKKEEEKEFDKLLLEA
jgi:putative transposase